MLPANGTSGGHASTGAGTGGSSPGVGVGVALARNNRWTATLDVAGELYQAYFDCRDDAVEALTAAGASP